MMNDNNYQAYFGNPNPATSAMHAFKSSYVQHKREHGYRDELRNVYSEELPPQRGTTSRAGWVVAPEFAQTVAMQYLTETSDNEASSNYKATYDCSPHDDVPVYDIDDGGYTDVNLDDDDCATCPTSSSTSDPQVIIIQSESLTNREDEDKHPSCLSRLCVRLFSA